MIDMHGILGEMSSARYCDVRLIRQEVAEVAFRGESADVFKHKSERVVCRAVSKGYGIASTNSHDIKSLKEVSELALKQAEMSESKIELLPLVAEKGEKIFSGKKEFEVESVLEFLKNMKDEVKDSLGNFYSRAEIIASYSFTDYHFVSSEGADITEKVPLVDVFVYVVAKGLSEGFSSKGIGGRGGFEIIEAENWNDIIEDLTMRAVESTEAGVLASKGAGTKFNIVLDNDGTGALAHEIAHMLEADIYQEKNFPKLSFEEPLELVDDPSLENGYGSFHWDDEGVQGSQKILLSEKGVQLLHTRLTAKGEDKPGNAHGVFHMPRPLMSNIYIKPSDWSIEEILEENRFGIYTKGVVRAESTVSEGRFELSPEIGYIVEKGVAKQPIKHLRIIGEIKKIIPNIDAIGKDFQLRPNIEKGFSISEGGPHIRISNIHCI
ncbi:MAG: TldD/PmbA family protein [Candidatus Jordarchaeum sp.]|uniref:TldD/PmbA family protein n=1 Tax=Candidatus Jordarchaeum sp. TaxID=2823881 RepID=UPI004048FF1B